MDLTPGRTLFGATLLRSLVMTQQGTDHTRLLRGASSTDGSPGPAPGVGAAVPSPLPSSLAAPQVDSLASFSDDSLKAVQLFSGLSGEELAVLKRSIFSQVFTAGRSIQPPKGNTIVVTEGEVDCSIKDAAGKPFSLATQGKGAVFGELSRLLGRSPQDEKVTLTAKSEVVVFAIPDSVFDDVVFGNRVASRELARQMAERLSAMNSFAKVAVDVGIDPSTVHPEKLSDRAAALLTRSVGSWSFVGGALVFVGAWSAFNSLAATKPFHFDGYPFVALNTAFSLMSAFTGSIILIAQNYRTKVDNSVIQVMQRLLIDAAAKIGSIARSQTKISRQVADLQRQVSELKARGIGLPEGSESADRGPPGTGTAGTDSRNGTEPPK